MISNILMCPLFKRITMIDQLWLIVVYAELVHIHAQTKSSFTQPLLVSNMFLSSECWKLEAIDSYIIVILPSMDPNGFQHSLKSYLFLS